MPAESHKGLAHSVGETFSSKVQFAVDAIQAFAALVGDTNPLHYEGSAAVSSSFGAVIASGTHTSALMFGAVAHHLSSRQPSLGLRSSVKMVRPVRAGDIVTINWTITDIKFVTKLRGWVVSLVGSMTRADGVVALTGDCETLLYPAESSY